MSKKRKRKFRIVRREVGQVILNVRNFFELEAASNQRIGLQNMTWRIELAMNVGRNIVLRVKSQDDVEELPGMEYVEKRKRNSTVPAMFVTYVHQAIRNCIAEKKHSVYHRSNTNFLSTLNLEHDWI